MSIVIPTGLYGLMENAMQEIDDVVSGWLNGAENVGGMGNPAGPLYIHGLSVTEVALTKPIGNLVTAHTTASCTPGGCYCC